MVKQLTDFAGDALLQHRWLGPVISAAVLCVTLIVQAYSQ
jgi:hypothetical protein